jgi:ABC-type transport system involved in multi-copper enzyme maturation permease subunit
MSGALWALSVQTFKMTLRSKWLAMFALVFFFFAFNLPFVSLQLMHLLPGNYVSTFMATLINTSFALMPLLALPLGAVIIVEERESGSLQYMLSTPIPRWKFLAARATGLLVATTSIIVIGFGLAALVEFRFSAGAVGLFYVTLAACILNATMGGVSLVLATVSRKRLTAHSLAILIWFLLTYAGASALGQISVLSRSGQYSALLPWIFLNPVEISRLVAVLQIPGSGIQDIGATGEAMQLIFANSALPVLYMAAAVWVAISLAASFVIFRFQDIR